MHHVYVLQSPIDGTPFYVGITDNPVYRRKQHETDPSSAANPGMFTEVPRGSSVRAKMVIIGSFSERTSALDMEKRLIKRMAALYGMRLYNRHHNECWQLWVRSNPDAPHPVPWPFIVELSYEAA